MSDPQWIPVTERMPNDGEEIFITSIEGTVGRTEFENGKFTAGFGAEYCNDDILAWMPLPKPYEGERRMSDLIDRDRLLDEIFFSKAIKHKHDDDNYYAIQVAIATLESLKSAPTVDAEPVRHGHWIELTDSNFKCSECKETIYTWIGRRNNYCPNCGAKMDEVEE